MLLHSTSLIPFGKYRGLNLGLVYLLTPSYINWMLEETSYYIGDIEFLKSLKVINKFGVHGLLAHYAEADTEEFKELWSKRVDFEDLKFSGYEDFTFSNLALGKNQDKIDFTYAEVIEREIIPEEQRRILIFYPGTKLKSTETSFTPSDEGLSKEESTILFFEVDNRNRAIEFLPQRKKLVVSSFFWPDWKISVDEMEKIFEEKRPLKGQIKEGYLILKK